MSDFLHDDHSSPQRSTRTAPSPSALHSSTGSLRNVMSEVEDDWVAEDFRLTPDARNRDDERARALDDDRRLTLRAWRRRDATPAEAARGDAIWRCGRELANVVYDVRPRGRVLEIGAGCSGFPGRAAARRPGVVKVTMLDCEPSAVLALRRALDHDRRHNADVVEAREITAEVFDVRNACKTREIEPKACYDTILAADVLYDEDWETAEGLFRFVSVMLARERDEEGREPTFYLAYAHRAAANFVPMLAVEYGLAFARSRKANAVVDDDASEDDRAEIEIGEFDRAPRE